MTPAQLCALGDCRVVAFMFHDRVAFGGVLIAIAVLYLWLTTVPLAAGAAWAWWTILVSGTLGFASFLAYLGYGYLDGWHGVGTAFLPPLFAAGVVRSARSRAGRPGRPGARRLPRPRPPPAPGTGGARGHRARDAPRGRHDPGRRDDPRLRPSGPGLHGPDRRGPPRGQSPARRPHRARSRGLRRRVLLLRHHRDHVRAVRAAVAQPPAGARPRRRGRIRGRHRRSPRGRLHRSAAPGARGGGSGPVRDRSRAGE